jgi:hypothetical protein
MEPDPQQQGADDAAGATDVTTRALFCLCERFGFPRDTAAAALLRDAQQQEEHQEEEEGSAYELLLDRGLVTLLQRGSGAEEVPSPHLATTPGGSDDDDDDDDDAGPKYTLGLVGSPEAADSGTTAVLAPPSPPAGPFRGDEDSGDEEARQEELEALQSIYGDEDFRRVSARRAELVLRVGGADEAEGGGGAGAVLTMALLESRRYPGACGSPPLVALSGEGLRPEQNLALTWAAARQATELAAASPGEVVLYELCNWVSNELPPALWIREEAPEPAPVDALPPALAVVDAAAGDEGDTPAGQWHYDVTFKDQSIGRVYASAVRRQLRALRGSGAATDEAATDVDFAPGQKVEARLSADAKWERATVLSMQHRSTGERRGGSGGVDGSGGGGAGGAARAERREALQRKGRGPFGSTTLESYANSRRS